MNVNPMTPMTIVKLLTGVPLDDGYTDTLEFSSVSNQTNYFNGKSLYTFSNLGPVRLQNAIRISKNADSIYNCNYLMFQNSNFGNKWFYAFIKEIKFININMCEVVFSLDVMQTWYFDYQLKSTLVEREHSNTDEIGSNIQPEPIILGELTTSGLNSLFTTDWGIVVASTLNVEEVPAFGTLYGGIYSGLSYWYFDATESGVETLNMYLESMSKHEGAIVSIFMYPSTFWKSNFQPVQTIIQAGTYKYGESLGGYIPVNKKLFTSPFNRLVLTSIDGSIKEYDLQLFSGDVCGFEITCSISPNPSIVAYPLNYKGQVKNFSESIVLADIPICSWTSDTYKAFLAQNMGSSGLSILASLVGVGAGVAVGNPVSILGGGLSIAQTANSFEVAKLRPPAFHGSTGSFPLFGAGFKSIYHSHVYPQREFLEKADQFLSLYGYATNTVKIPNRTGRKSWNFIKTKDCKATGSIPFDDMEKIKNIYNGGITFWHGDYVGDYDRDNSII